MSNNIENKKKKKARRSWKWNRFGLAVRHSSKAKLAVVILYYTSIGYIPEIFLSWLFPCDFHIIVCQCGPLLFHRLYKYIYIYANGTPLKQLDEVLYEIYVLDSGLWPTRTKENRWKYLWKTNYIYDNRCILTCLSSPPPMLITINAVRIV